ncbi:uncharacterized protein LOC110426178 [Herrania umbratica]|uniref:Uncharacterized protein LOC110426178 n=1 Tax=Herrania umbratica TaxID=108875 RepID=A0A6J1BCY7_9ROSI|nr:uncharacterized protein LOC110426178 [Herrania umbratica]
MNIKLASHEHSLSFINSQNAPSLFTDPPERYCNACAKQISNAAYLCVQCYFWLHESCASEVQNLPLEIIHPLHSQHQLGLKLSYEDFICDKCLYISGGSRYKCYECHFNLELACASSTNDPVLEEEWQRLKDGKKKEIQHYSHPEKLTIFKYRKIREHDYDCGWCEKRLSEVCYGCLECEFFLHELCRDKIPRTLYHPFHPSHPLHLLYKETNDDCNACGDQIIETATHHWYRNYFCLTCNFCLHFRCAKLLPTLKHECHDHLLTYFKKSEPSQNAKPCSSCGTPCGYDFYRCVECNFNVHPICVPIPSSAEHRYHRHPLNYMDLVAEDHSEEYYCDICESERNPAHPAYCCEKCTYITHIHCVLNEDKISFEKVSSSTPRSIYSNTLLTEEMEHNEVIDGIRTPKQLLIRPMIHEHPMKFYEKVKKSWKNHYCEACRLVVNGPSYICTTCSDHTFLIVCDECRDVCFGFFYRCDECDFKLDVKCAILTAHKTEVLQLRKMERVAEFIHPHKLVLANCRDPIEKKSCMVCELPILGPAYFCLNRYCSVQVHESCLGTPQEMQLPFHLEHMLFFGKNYRISHCYACGRMILHDFRYSCEQCDLNLHSLCANSIRQPLKCQSHEHNLYYFGTKFQESQFSFFPCNECSQDCGGPFYRCLECAINFHLDCVPIPHIVKSRRHIHLLIIKDSFVEDDSEESYCDICEEERCRDDYVYCCEECNGLFAAHIECVLTKVENITAAIDASSNLVLDIEKNSAQDLIQPSLEMNPQKRMWGRECFDDNESMDQDKEEDSSVSESEKLPLSSEDEDSSPFELNPEKTMWWREYFNSSESTDQDKEEDSTVSESEKLPRSSEEEDSTVSESEKLSSSSEEEDSSASELEE